MIRTPKQLAGKWKTMPANVQRAHVLALLPHIKEAVEKRDHYRVNVLTSVLSGLAGGARVFTPTALTKAP